MTSSADQKERERGGESVSWGEAVYDGREERERESALPPPLPRPSTCLAALMMSRSVKEEEEKERRRRRRRRRGGICCLEGFSATFSPPSLPPSLSHTNRVMSSPPAGRDIATALDGRTDEPTEHGKGKWVEGRASAACGRSPTVAPSLSFLHNTTRPP